MTCSLLLLGGRRRAPRLAGRRLCRAGGGRGRRAAVGGAERHLDRHRRAPPHRGQRRRVRLRHGGLRTLRRRQGARLEGRLPRVCGALLLRRGRPARPVRKVLQTTPTVTGVQASRPATRPRRPAARRLPADAKRTPTAHPPSGATPKGLRGQVPAETRQRQALAERPASVSKCTGEVGSRVCLSAVCDPKADECGLARGGDQCT